MNRLFRCFVIVLLGVMPLPVVGAGQSGAVVIHGKGESPERVKAIMNALRLENVLVAAPELPWSARRLYDRPASDADAEVDAAIAQLRSDGARRVYIIGESLGASYALRYASRPGVTGIVAIAPNHAPESPLYIRSYADDIRKARDLIASGRPQALLEFLDVIWGDRRNRITTSARSFLSYFDPTGPLNMTSIVQGVRRDVLVLWIVPQGDSVQRQYSLDLYQRLPKNPGSRLVELPVQYINVAGASVPAIVQWMRDTVPYIQNE